MDVQLQELLDRIKTEGVEAAEEQAQRVLAEAQARSAEILAGAQKEAAKIVAEARAEASRFEHNATEAVRQAGRDLILGLKGRIAALFDALLRQETRAAYTPAVLQEAVVALVKAWAGKDAAAAPVQVLLPADQLAAVEKALQSRLAGEIKKGLEIQGLPGLEAGFRVGMKDGSAYFDLSDEGIAQILAEFLTPRVAAIIQGAVGS